MAPLSAFSFGRCFQVIRAVGRRDGEEWKSCGNGDGEEDEEREEVDKDEKEGGIEAGSMGFPSPLF